MPLVKVLIRAVTRPWPLFTAAVILALCFAARTLLPVYFESIPVMPSLICCAVFCVIGLLFMAVPFVSTSLPAPLSIRGRVPSRRCWLRTASTLSAGTRCISASCCSCSAPGSSSRAYTELSVLRSCSWSLTGFRSRQRRGLSSASSGLTIQITAGASGAGSELS